MPAPKGNQFWKQRSKHGRDTLFKTPELMWEAACQYFEWCDNNPIIEHKVSFYNGEQVDGELKHQRVYTLSGLCLFMGATVSYFRQFNPDNKDFSPVLENIRDAINTQKFEGASSGIFNANLIARDLGLSDSLKQDNTSSDGSMSPIRVELVSPPSFGGDND